MRMYVVENLFIAFQKLSEGCLIMTI